MNDCCAIENRVRDFVAAHGSGGIIVGLSGGADSVALLAALVSCGARCIAVHCNFGLRGAESDRDMSHSIDVCRQLGVECKVVHFDVKAYMRDHKCSMETACRELRYNKFEEIRIATGCEWIAVAHHREDNNETLMLNLFRGTGISGLRGMKPVNGRIIRPLLGVTKNELLEYLAAKGLTYITDSSNLQSDFARNKVRNLIMPAIRDSFADADTGIATTISNLAQTDSFIAEMIELEKERFVAADGSIAVDRLIRQRKNASYILYEILKEEGFNATHTGDIIRSCISNASGKEFCSALGIKRVLDRGSLLLAKDDAPERIDVIIETVPITEFHPGVSPAIEYFGMEAMDGVPLTVRPWRQGDRMRPFGMKGSRLISDMLSDAKLSLIQKQNVRLLVKGDEILWLIGMRRSALYPVDKKAAHIIKVSASELPCSQK